MTSLDLEELGFDPDEEYVFEEDSAIYTESVVSGLSNSDKREPPFVIQKRLFLDKVDGNYALMYNSSSIYRRVNKCFYKPIADKLTQFMNDMWGEYELSRIQRKKTEVSCAASFERLLTIDSHSSNTILI